MIRWCCDGFQAHFEKAGQRGFAIFVTPVYGAARFVLQHRALDAGDAGPQEHPSPISVVSQMQLVYCPWCGKNLVSFYGEDPPALRLPNLGIDQAT